MIEDLLVNVHRPAQYLGNEWNAAKGDFFDSAEFGGFGLGIGGDFYRCGFDGFFG